MAENGVVTLSPVRPAPAAPKRDAMTAIPAVDPKAAAPALPMIVAAPAATRGAARPPVRPEDAARDITKLLSLKNPRQALPCAATAAGRAFCMFNKEAFWDLPQALNLCPNSLADFRWMKNNFKVKGRLRGDLGWALLCLFRKHWSNLTLLISEWRSDPLITRQQRRRKHFKGWQPQFNTSPS